MFNSSQEGFDLIETVHRDPVTQRAFAGFFHNYQIIKRQTVVLYPRKSFHNNHIPTPRQYVAYRKLARILGEDFLFNQPMEYVDLDQNKIPLKEKFGSLFENTNKRYDLIFTSGFFWDDRKERRELMIDYLCSLLSRGNVKITIYSQDTDLKNEHKLQNYSNFTVFPINYRIDIHYIIIRACSKTP